MKGYLRLQLLISFIFLFNSTFPQRLDKVREFSSIDNSIFTDYNKIYDQPEAMLSRFQSLKNICERYDYKIGVCMCELRIAQCHFVLQHANEVLRSATDLEIKGISLKNDSILLFAKILRARQLGLAWMSLEALNIINECFRRVSSMENSSTRNNIYGSLFTLKAQYSSGLNQAPSIRTCLRYHFKALCYYSKTRYSNAMGISCGNIGKCYLELQQFDSALFYFKKSALLYKGQKIRLKINYSNLGKICIGLKRYEEALLYLARAKRIPVNRQGDLYLDGIVCDSYIKVYSALQRPDSVFKYTKLKNKYTGLSNSVEKNIILNTNNVLIKIESNKSSKTKTLQSVIICCVALILVVLIMLSLRFYMRKLKLKREYSVKEAELHFNSTELAGLKRKVSYSYQELIELAKQDSPLFVAVFRELYPGFYSKLLQILPDITLTEQKICFYLKLDFSSKEIAQYTSVTVKAVQNRKNRLRKRFGLDDGDDLYKFLQDIGS